MTTSVICYTKTAIAIISKLGESVTNLKADGYVLSGYAIAPFIFGLI